jgi:RNA polymerase sigma factor, sigma-70 family
MLLLILDEKQRDNDPKIEVLNEYYNEILSYCRYHLDFNQSTAEECTQDVFITYFKSLANKKIQNPHAWLYRVADNYINRYIKDITIQKRMIVEFPNSETDNKTIDEQFVYNQDFDSLIFSKDDFETYERELLSCLNENELDFFNLFFRQHKSVQELSLYYNKSENAIYKRLQRLRIKLKEQIKKLATKDL